MFADRTLKRLAIAAVVFGILTVVSGRALFGGPAAREASLSLRTRVRGA